MKQNKITMYHGGGRGKTSVALGMAVQYASAGKRVIFISFMKGKESVIKQVTGLEPMLKVFCISKSDKTYNELEEDEKSEERLSIENGINFAKKVIQTQECDFLVLDEILGVLSEQLYAIDDFIEFLKLLNNNMELVLTGDVCPPTLKDFIDESYIIERDS